MAWRIVGGLTGWLMSLAPLVIVNVLAFTGVIQPGDTAIAGGVGLLAGIALGGMVAGLLGGRRGAGGRGGATAGVITGALYAGSLVGLMYALREQHVLPYLLAQHPVRAIGAIGFVACILMIIAAMTGAASGRRSERIAIDQMAAAQRTHGASAPSMSQPRSAPYRQPSQPRPNMAPRQSTRESSREQAPRW